MAELILALDLPDSGEALRLVDRLGDDIGWYKIGAPLFTRAGPSVVRELKARDKHVFLDLKYHDIPNTVARSVEAAAAMDVELLTVHTSGGSDMLRAAREAAGEDGPDVLGVTVLTSFAALDVEEVWGKEIRSLHDDVFRLAGIAAHAGLAGVVASALEVEALKRTHGREFRVITPGIRPAGSVRADQSRTATPGDAVRAGSDFLVVGRPILNAEDPPAAARRIRAEMHEAAEGGG